MSLKSPDQPSVFIFIHEKFEALMNIPRGQSPTHTYTHTHTQINDSFNSPARINSTLRPYVYREKSLHNIQFKPFMNLFFKNKKINLNRILKNKPELTPDPDIHAD